MTERTIRLIPAVLHADGFRGWRGTGAASEFVEQVARQAPLASDGLNQIRLTACRTVARILDNDEHKELWTEAEAALVEVLEACYWEPEYRQRRHLAAVKT